MQDVCSNCHNQEYINNFYIQYDELIYLYNGKFATPGKELMALAKPLLKPVVFANKLDFIWFEIWHHEGRRARHGASMMGPDYTHWHGTYEVAKHFYTELIPELEELAEKNLHSEDAVRVDQAKLLQEKLEAVLNTDDHKWYLGKMDPDEAQRRDDEREEFKARYSN